MSSRAKIKKLERDRGDESRRLGTLVEREISLRCTQAGFTVNKSDEDTQGWDFFLQLPASNEVRSFLDLSPPQLSCLVQVKGTVSTEGDTRMTLANALRLAKSPTPTFVVIASVSNSSIARLWLLHCGERFIKKTLERLVKERHRQPATLNRIWLNLNGSEGDEVPVDGIELRAAIARYVGSNTYEYVHQKERWLNTVGYTGPTKSLAMTVRTTSPREHFSHLARFAVGLERSLSVDSVRIYDLRFGQKRYESSHKDVTIEMPKILTGPAAKVELRGPDEQSIIFDGRTYRASAIFPFIPPEHDIVRVTTERFDIYIECDRDNAELMQVHWTLRGMDEHLSETQLGGLADAAKGMRWLISGVAKVSLRIHGKVHDLPLGTPLKPAANLVESLQDIENFGIVTHAFGMQLGDDNMMGEDLADQRQRLSILACVATGSDAQAAAQFPADAIPSGFDLGERCALLFAPWVRTTRSVLVVVTAMVGVVTDVDDQLGGRQLTCNRLIALSKRLVSVGTPVDIARMYDEAEAVLNGMGVTRIYKPAKDERSA